MTEEPALYMPTDRCPVLTCRSTAIHRHDADTALARQVAKAWGNTAVCPIDQCMECGAFWEPWPDKTPADCVERTRCDNCAFGAGSRESADKEEWAGLIAMAENAAEWSGVQEAPTSWFACHKGIPIRLDTEANTISFDYQSAGLAPFHQTCAGFLKMMWAFKDKAGCAP